MALARIDSGKDNQVISYGNDNGDDVMETNTNSELHELSLTCGVAGHESGSVYLESGSVGHNLPSGSLSNDLYCAELSLNVGHESGLTSDKCESGSAAHEPGSAADESGSVRESGSAGRESIAGNLLIEAAEKGDLSKVHDVLNKVKPDYKTKYQARSALHLACGYGQYDVADKLLQAGADPMLYSTSGRTPLHEACQGGHTEVLTLLLQHTREVDSQDRDGQTPVHIAALHGELHCIKLLHDQDGSLVVEDKAGRQPAHLAAVHNHAHVLQYLYDAGVDLECPDEMGKLPVHYAAQHGALSCLKCLMERDSDITIGDGLGNLPMHYAAWHDQLDCMRFLVKQGSLIDFSNIEKKTSLHVAAQHGGVNVLHWLLEKRANPNSVDVHGHTGAHYACQTGHAECYHCLLHHGADLTITNTRGDDTLAWAKKHGHSLRIQKAMRSEISCPQCKARQDHDKWKDKFKPSPVLMSVDQLKQQAYVSPLRQVPTQARQTTQRKGKLAAGQSIMTHTAKTKTKLPKRDLPTKYFGEHVEINDLYKFKI